MYLENFVCMCDLRDLLRDDVRVALLNHANFEILACAREECNEYAFSGKIRGWMNGAREIQRRRIRMIALVAVGGHIPTANGENCEYGAKYQ